jgi:hypothetical protein
MVDGGKTVSTPDSRENVNYVVLRKSEVIGILQTLEGLKKQLQPLLERKSK